jgi:hypothetical protein
LECDRECAAGDGDDPDERSRCTADEADDRTDDGTGGETGSDSEREPCGYALECIKALECDRATLFRKTDRLEVELADAKASIAQLTTYIAQRLGSP